MRERTHSLAIRMPAAALPATSAVATAVLTVAWWLTMIGLTAPSVPHMGVVITTAAVAVAVVAVASPPHMRAMLSQWTFRRIAVGRQEIAPGVGRRWVRAPRAVRVPASQEIALARVARPRAPGQGFVTA